MALCLPWQQQEPLNGAFSSWQRILDGFTFSVLVFTPKWSRICRASDTLLVGVG